MYTKVLQNVTKVDFDWGHFGVRPCPKKFLGGESGG